MNHALVWECLALEPTSDEGSIKRAYAARIRAYRPDTHPKEFSEIRQAYELALHLARQEVQRIPSEATEPAEPETAVPVPPVSNATPDDPATAPSDTADATRFNAQAWLQELWQWQFERGDLAASNLLHQQFAALDSQTIDAKLDYEGHLLHAFLSSATPPLAVLFEGSRLFQWPSRRAEVAQMFGECGVQRLGLLMNMANEYMHARHFSSNRWSQRLFAGAGSGLPRYASTLHVAAARSAALYWQRLCEASNLPQMQEVCNPAVSQRLNGWLLLSTDLFFAMAICAMVWVKLVDTPNRAEGWMGMVLTALIGLAAAAAPAVWRWFVSTAMFRRIAIVGASFSNVPLGVRAVAISALLFLALVASDQSSSFAAQWVGKATLASFAVLLGLGLAVGLWFLIRFGEALVMRPWLMLQRASDAHAFEQARESRSQPWCGPTVVARVRALPGAIKLDRMERKRLKQLDAQRRREAKAVRPFQSASGGSSNHWWIWIAVVVLFNVFKAIAK